MACFPSVKQLIASAELSSISGYIFVAHRLTFPELIKTFMAIRSFVQKNRCFIIDFSAKITMIIRMTSQQDLLGLKQTLRSFHLGDIMSYVDVTSIIQIAHSQSTLFYHSCFNILTRFLESRKYFNWNALGDQNYVCSLSAKPCIFI